MNSALASYRVLDLTDEKGWLCGKVLGDLGADVIKVEKPGGDPGRNVGPFYQGTPHPEKSLYWFAYNSSKRSVTLDIEKSEGQEILQKLAQKADFVIESFPPGYMGALGLGYAELSAINPSIIFTSITPFGQHGPHKDYQAPDIVAMAMGGLMYITGDKDRPPVRVSAEQAYLHAGIHAAAGSLISHYHRQLTGEGQHVDVSIQESVLCTLLHEPVNWDVAHIITRREGPLSRRGSVCLREIFDCKDGQVCFRIFGGPYGKGIRPLVEWMDSQGKAGILKDIDWEAVDMAKVLQATEDAWEKTFADFFMEYTVAELYAEAMKRGFYLQPNQDSRQVAEDAQLRARQFWTNVEHPELGATITYPGAPFRSTETSWQIRRRPPLIGEHNREIYEKELGFSKSKIANLKRNHVI